MEGIRTNETGSVSVKTHGAIFIYLNLIWIEKLLPKEIYLPNMDTDPVYDTVSSATGLTDHHAKDIRHH